MVLFLNLNEQQEFKKPVNVSGIINGPTIPFNFSKTRKSLLRVPVILPCLNQILIEIWSDKENLTPKFSENWKVLQLIVIFDLTYGGETFLEGKNYKIFRLNCKWEHVFGRFVWLSTPSELFWYKPISEPDILGNSKKISRDSWPRRVPFESGRLRISKGSVISKWWLRIFPSWHTRNYETFTFESLVSLHDLVRKGVFGYVNILTRQKMHTRLNFERLAIKILIFLPKIRPAGY